MVLNRLSQEQEETEALHEQSELGPDFHEEPPLQEYNEPQRRTFPEDYVAEIPEKQPHAYTQRENSRQSNAQVDPPKQVSSKRIIFNEGVVHSESASQPTFSLAEILSFYDELGVEEKDSFKHEAIGMVNAYRKQTKVVPHSSPLPELAAYLDEEMQTLHHKEIAEALNLAFLDVMRGSLPRDIYAFFMNQKHLFSDCLEAFSHSGNLKTVVQSIKKKCQMLVFHGQAPGSISSSVVTHN